MLIIPRDRMAPLLLASAWACSWLLLRISEEGVPV